MDSEKEKNRLSDIVLERVGLTGNLLSAPVSPSLEPVVEIPSHGSQVRAGKVTGPEEYKRRFLVPAPRAAEWKTAYIDGRLHRRIAMLVRAAGCGSISGLSSGCWNSIWRNTGRTSPPCSVRSTVPGMRTDSREEHLADKTLSLSKKAYHDRKERKRADWSWRDGRGPHP